MASRVSRNLVGSLKGRYRSTHAAAASSESVSLPKQAPKLTKLPNGIVVASVENYSPVSRVAVVFNAGSRFETGDNLGVTHCLRIASGLTNQNSTQFKINRSIQQTGGNLSCTATREHMYYSVDCTRDNIKNIMEIVRDVTTAPAFKPWELGDSKHRLTLDLAILDSQPGVKLCEMLHQAAFRSTLGRSLFTPEFMIEKFSTEQLLHYVKTFYTGDRMAIVGAGVDHDMLVAEAKKFTPFSAAAGSSEKAIYHGGELREHTNNPLTYAAIGVEGPGMSASDVLHVGVLQQIMGTGPFVKFSNNTAVSKLGQAVAKASTQPFAISCLNSSYTDAGLFGFSTVAQPDDIGTVLKAAFKEFAAVTKGAIKDEDVARAKSQLKAWVLMNTENQEGAVTNLAEQALGQQTVTPVEEVAKQIDAVTTADVLKVAKKIINGKPTMVAIGDLSKTPYLDELYR